MTFSSILKKHSVFVFMAIWMTFLGCIPQNAFCMPVPSGLNTSVVNSDREVYIKKIEALLSQEPVKKRLAEFGIKEDVLRMRLSELSDEQLYELASRTDQIKAGGGATAIVVGVLVVLCVIFLVFLFTTHEIKIEPKEDSL